MSILSARAAAVWMHSAISEVMSIYTNVQFQWSFTFTEAIFGFSASFRSFWGFVFNLIRCWNFLNREHEFLTTGTWVVCWRLKQFDENGSIWFSLVQFSQSKNQTIENLGTFLANIYDITKRFNDYLNRDIKINDGGIVLDILFVHILSLLTTSLKLCTVRTRAAIRMEMSSTRARAVSMSRLSSRVLLFHHGT